MAITKSVFVVCEYWSDHYSGFWKLHKILDIYDNYTDAYGNVQELNTQKDDNIMYKIKERSMTVNLGVNFYSG
jgi:hypothetical protein